MFDIIVAVEKNNGIGNKNSLPWNIPLDMEYFKETTKNTKFPNQNNAVIMGWNTWNSIPVKFRPLKDRINIIITNNHKDHIPKDPNIVIASDLDDALEKTKHFIIDKKFVIGGKKLYDVALKHSGLDNLLITEIDKEFECNMFLDFDREAYELTNSSGNIAYQDFNINFNIYKKNHQEYNYLNLLEKTINFGELRQTRNALTYSLFGDQLTFDISNSFPLLTTKKMFWRGIVEELLFFIRGETDSKLLNEKNIKIWNGNTSKEFLENLNLPYEEGLMGPMYGYQWRFYNKPYNQDTNDTGIDQLNNCINLIKNDPTNRRILLTAYNPLQLKESVLAPCHSIIIQFYVKDNKLDCHMYQRSADIFLGLPFNIASTSLLTYIIAKVTNLNPGKMIISLGDVHLYESHIEQAREQIKRIPLKFPKLEILKDIKTINDIENLNLIDFKLSNYNSYKNIKATMVA